MRVEIRELQRAPARTVLGLCLFRDLAQSCHERNRGHRGQRNQYRQRDNEKSKQGRGESA